MLARVPPDVPEADTGRRSATPLVWVLEDDKLGHTMQSVALADGAGLAVYAQERCASTPSIA